MALFESVSEASCRCSTNYVCQILHRHVPIVQHPSDCAGFCRYDILPAEFAEGLTETIKLCLCMLYV
jgi:hypothetical protein